MFTSSHWRKKLPRKQRIRSLRPSLATSLDLQRRLSMASAKNFVVTVPADEVPRRHARRVNKLQGNPATVVTDMATLPQSAFTSRPNATSAGEKSHVVKACRRKRRTTTNYVEAQSDQPGECQLPIFNVNVNNASTTTHKPYLTNVNVNGANIQLKLTPGVQSP